MSVGLYYPSWSSPWTSDPTKMDLALLTNVTIVNIAFVQPNIGYVKGSNSFAGTGLEFSQDFGVVAKAIGLLQQKGVKVMLSVGGSTYWSTPQPFHTQNCIDLMNDLHCDGIDVDWEVGYSDRRSLTMAIQDLKQKGCPLISFAGFSTGAYGSDGSQYMGMNIDAMENAGGDIAWVNIMSYDAGPTYDALGAFTCYRIYYKGPLLLGFEPGPQSWGGYVETYDDVAKRTDWVKKDGPKNGIFVWCKGKDTTGSPSVDFTLSYATQQLNTVVPVTVVSPPATIPCPHCGTALKLVLA